jgi:hypothetical protein
MRISMLASPLDGLAAVFFLERYWHMYFGLVFAGIRLQLLRIRHLIS